MFLSDPVSDTSFETLDTETFERPTNPKLTFMDNFFLIFIIWYLVIRSIRIDVPVPAPYN